MQRHDGKAKPIFFASRVLSPAERACSITERECLAVVWALQKFREYTFQNKVIVKTDHSALTSLLKMQMPRNARLCRWLTVLMDCNLEIQHIKGTANGPADCMSRLVNVPPEAKKEGSVPASALRPQSEEDETYNLVSSSFRSQIVAALQEDANFREIYESVKINGPSDHYQLINGILYYKNYNNRLRLVIPQTLVADLIKAYHDSPYAIHSGATRTYKKLARKYYWSFMKKDVQKYVNSCLACATRKPSNQPKVGSMIPHEITEPFEKVYMDFLGPLPSSYPGQFQYIMVLVDQATKFLICQPARSANAETLAKFLLNHLCTWRTKATCHGQCFHQ